MDFRDLPDEAAFRREVREFLLGEHERDQAYSSSSKISSNAWMKQLATRGWAAPAWPKEYGGAGMTIMQQFIFNEELALARIPRPIGVGISLAGPTIITYGTDDQKKENLPGMLSGTTVWCQGFSEPGSGSDLASLETRAVRDGADYLLS